jgi:hypothetical protein
VNEETISRYAESRPDVWLLYEIYKRMGAIENLLMILDVRDKPVAVTDSTEKADSPDAVKSVRTVKRKPAAKRTPTKRTTTKKG